jgi:hypothetical protein
MTGVGGWGSSGFQMMSPSELRKQRWTYVKYWIARLNKDRKAVADAAKKG